MEDKELYAALTTAIHTIGDYRLTVNSLRERIADLEKRLQTAEQSSSLWWRKYKELQGEESEDE